ncbi:hypothetical protein NC651_005504 [Populus alba x Populus x berolinensis]|nr:hypothetical protein NC651_005504 [Populus alba x Populus x berolinensis]
MVAIPSLIFCSVEVSNWHLASNIIAGISEVLLGKADENLFSDTQELSYKCRDTGISICWLWKCGICTLSKGEHGDYDYGWMVFGLFRSGEGSYRRGRDKFPMLKGFKPTPLSATDVNQAQLLAGFLGRGCRMKIQGLSVLEIKAFNNCFLVDSQARTRKPAEKKTMGASGFAI